MSLKPEIENHIKDKLSSVEKMYVFASELADNRPVGDRITMETLVDKVNKSFPDIQKSDIQALLRILAVGFPNIKVNTGRYGGWVKLSEESSFKKDEKVEEDNE